MMRKSMKDMLYTLGAQYLFEAENGCAAIAAMKKQKFDIILCDYNLGSGKNGQQVLEEARHKNLFPYSAIFIIVSAHQSAIDVLSTIENKPDEYLAKPFNAQQLSRRIEKSYARKQQFSIIEQSIDKENYARAIHLCDDALAKNNKGTHSHLLKLRAELAIKTGDLDKASSIYQQALERRELAWAQLGMGIIAFFQNDFELATSLFKDLIEKNPLLMEAYDWLAKTYQALDKTTEAEFTLNQAVEISPHSFFRQKELASIAERNGNFDAAEKACKAVTHLGKHSIHQSPSDFSNLAKIYSKKQENQQALKTLDRMRHQFVNNQEAELRAATVESEVYISIGDQKLAKQAFNKVNSLNDTLKNSSPKDLQLDIAKACYQNGETETADEIISSLVQNNIDDNDFMDSIRHMHADIGQDNYSEVLIQQTKQKLIDINNQGVKLFQQGQFKQAFAVFEQAVENMPHNKTILLNMAKVTVYDLKASGITQESLLLAQHYINRAKQAGVSTDKLGNLQLEFENLTHTPPSLV